jgi:hypothetical protein
MPPAASPPRSPRRRGADLQCTHEFPTKRGDCGNLARYVLQAPETVITALSGAEYEEKIKHSPLVLSGHTEVEYNGGGMSPGLDIQSLLDGSNDRLRERQGPCALTGAP